MSSKAETVADLLASRGYANECDTARIAHVLREAFPESAPHQPAKAARELAVDMVCGIIPSATPEWAKFVTNKWTAEIERFVAARLAERAPSPSVEDKHCPKCRWVNGGNGVEEHCVSCLVQINDLTHYEPAATPPSTEAKP
jgi:hypothetical protein